MREVALSLGTVEHVPMKKRKSIARAACLSVGLALVSLALVSLAPEVRAQTQPIPMSPELKAFMLRPDEQRLFHAVMEREWQYAIENCPSPVVRAVNVAVGAAPTFDASGSPVSGQWRAIARVEGCGKTRTLTVVYAFGKDGKMIRAALLPGTTAADPRLQMDSIMYAAMGMSKLTPKNCKDTKVSDTKFVAFEGANAPPAGGTPGRLPWTEEWTVRSCGVTGLVTMHFRPNATGTNISTKLDETRRLDP